MDIYIWIIILLSTIIMICYEYIFQIIPAQKNYLLEKARMQLTEKLEILPGMPFTVYKNNKEAIAKEFKKELAESIKKDGQWDPILVKPNSHGYDLISGECRLKAIRRLGFEKINARILNVTVDEAHLLALKANLMRRDLNPIEEAEAVFLPDCSKIKCDKFMVVVLPLVPVTPITVSFLPGKP